jgi:hypothetical protein
LHDELRTALDADPTGADSAKENPPTNGPSDGGA